MDAVLALLTGAALALPVLVAVVPLITLLTGRRRVVPAGLLYLAALAMLVAYVVTANAHMDWADRTGGQGSILAGAGWLIGAVAAAAGAVYLSLVRPRATTAA